MVLSFNISNLDYFKVDYLILQKSYFEIFKVYEYDIIGCKDIGARKSDFDGETQFLYV